MNVLLTGACGNIGTAIIKHLGGSEGYEFTYLDVVDHPEYEVFEGDITVYEEIRPAFEGQDAVVHLARIPWTGPSRIFEWTETMAQNLEGLTNVYGAAVDAGVETVVYASSNSAVGMYEVDHAPEIYFPDSEVTIDHTVPVRPDSLYGIEKVYGEVMGRYCADKAGLRVAAIRIGNIQPAEYDYPAGMADRKVEAGELERGTEAYREAVARQRCVWQSRRDFAQMVDRCLQTPSYDYEIFYGISDNERSWFDISHAREVLGYTPQDSGDADE